MGWVSFGCLVWVPELHYSVSFSVLLIPSHRTAVWLNDFIESWVFVPLCCLTEFKYRVALLIRQVWYRVLSFVLLLRFEFLHHAESALCYWVGVDSCSESSTIVCPSLRLSLCLSGSWVSPSHRAAALFWVLVSSHCSLSFVIAAFCRVLSRVCKSECLCRFRCNGFELLSCCILFSVLYWVVSPVCLSVFSECV